MFENLIGRLTEDMETSSLPLAIIGLSTPHAEAIGFFCVLRGNANNAYSVGGTRSVNSDKYQIFQRKNQEK
jgi:hypothetical protein